MRYELNTPDAFRHRMSELARNIMWQYGDVFLSTSQQVELFGDGVEIDFSKDRELRRDSLPIADTAFFNKKAHITFVEEDYEYILDVICKPDNLNGHKAASFYIGAGVAPAVLHEFLARNRDFGMIDSTYSHLLKSPPKDKLIERLMINQGTSSDLPKLIDGLFENLMSSDEKRLVRINLMRYGIGSLFRVMESADEGWSMWQRDDKDRVGYILSFRDACAAEMADMLRAQRRLDVITRALGKNEDWQSINFYDRVPEILVAGSVPMTAEEIDEINSLLMFA